MKKLLMKFAICIMQAIYFVMKLLPVKNKVIFISRQANTIPLDFRLLREALEELDKDTCYKMLIRKLESGIVNKMKYICHIFCQMYHMATAKVVVLDGYCIAASVLKHKKSLYIIQLWHALGAIKKFGFQALDTDEGSSSEVAYTMKMHNNYDCVLCASRRTAEIFSEAFNAPMNKFEILGMPRVDYILSAADRNDEILETHPEFEGKPTILYIPTFRKNEHLDLSEVETAVDLEKYNFIIKAHPLERKAVDLKYLADRKFGTYDLVKFADYIITDYSAVAIEASLLSKPVLFYVYDYEKYIHNRGLNIDPYVEMPGATRKTLKEIMGIIENGKYDMTELNAFRKKYVETVLFNNTKKIAQKINELV